MDVDPALTPDLRTGILLLLQDFASSIQLFGTWRTSRLGKKAVGQAEFETSLCEGKEAVERRWEILYQRHGPKFYTGDNKVIESLIKIKAVFAQNIIRPLTESTLETGGKAVATHPITLRLVSEETRKNTLSALDDFSRRLSFNTANMYKNPDPGDVLPPMPLLPNPSQVSLASTNSEQTIYPNSSQSTFASQNTNQGPPRPPRPYPAHNNSSQTSFAARARQNAQHPNNPYNQFRPQPPRIQEPTPQLTWEAYEDDRDIPPSSSTWSLGTLSTSSLFHRNSSMTLRSTFGKPYYSITPHKESAPIVPTFTTESVSATSTSTFLDEGDDHVDKLWEKSRSSGGVLAKPRPKSAPPLQIPWNVPDEIEEGNSESGRDGGDGPVRWNSNSGRAKTSEITKKNDLLSPHSPLPMPPGRKLRNAPSINFSNPTPRFGRSVSGPAG